MIDLAQATSIVDNALAHGRTMGLPPLTVAVLDAHGCLVAFKREDGSSLLRPEIAQAKAYGTLAHRAMNEIVFGVAISVQLLASGSSTNTLVSASTTGRPALA